ncbi:hypothetical protein EV715DRAFT_287214 [Schizophyllum commune]
MSQAAPLSRDPDLWIEDGNLVVQAAPRLFRVHRGVLASNSGFFRGIVDFPESRVQNTCDGVPLITLHDDDARDVAQFLKANYIFDYFRPPPAKTTFEILEGVLRIAHKYDAPALRRCALQHLAISYVTSYHDLKDIPIRSYRVDDEEELSTHEVIATINLAQEVHATWLLPTAYYYAGASFTAAELDEASDWCASIVGEDGTLNGSEFMDVCHDCLAQLTVEYLEWLRRAWIGLPSLFGLPDWHDLAQMKKQDLELP